MGMRGSHETRAIVRETIERAGTLVSAALALAGCALLVACVALALAVRARRT